MGEDVSVLARRRSPLAGTGFGLDSPGLGMAEEPFRSLVEVRCVDEPAVAGAGTWRLGPTWWLVDGAPPTRPVLEVPLAAAVRVAHPDAHVVDVSAQRTTIVLTGEHAERLVAHGCPIDLSRLGPGEATQGTLAGAQVILQRTPDTIRPDTIRVLVRSAFARHLAAWLTDAASEYV